MQYASKRKAFISYHHRGDQEWFNEFARHFAINYEIFYDKSLDNRIRSDDPEYVNRKIREEYIVGSSITIVLCGAETWKRKYVDWEIYSTLHCEHALLGITLPTAIKDNMGRISVPERLHNNIQSGYAFWISRWITDPQMLQASIEIAIQKSEDKSKICNDKEKMVRNYS